MNSWHGKALHIDLSSRTVRTKDLHQQLLSTRIGGRGLGVELMKDFFRLDPYDPAMPLIFAVGPLCGTPAPASSRMSVVSRSPLTGTITDSSVGGTFPLKLKSAGYDCLVVTGKASSPVYIRDQGRQCRNQGRVLALGQGLPRDERSFSRRKALSACIGPAGENLVRFANIMIGGANSAGRGGLGAVMGAKNLKAIVVDGSKKTTIADPHGFKKAQDDVMRLLRASPVVMGELGLGEYGTSTLVDIVGQRKMAPTENFKKTFFPEARPIPVRASRRNSASRSTAARSAPSSARSSPPAAGRCPSTRPCPTSAP